MKTYTGKRAYPGLLMLTAISSIAMAAMSCPAQAQTESAQPIAVEAQPLEEALVAIGRKFGVSITAPDALTQGKTAPALSGVMTVDQALQRVLAGSGLTYRIADNGGFIITPGDTSSNEGQNLIIVRGEGRARSLQETASSVSVTTEDDLAKRAGPQSLRSVLEATPGVQFNAVNNDGPTVRGSDSSGAIGGSGIFVGGARGRTTLEIDGREANLTELAFGSTGTWDIKQIEVFVGPQTTNRGRNAVAGAFYIETNDPTQYYEAAGRVVVGNFDTKNYAGVLSGPIIQDQLAFRVAAEVTEHDSFVDLALPLAGGDTTNPFGDFGFDPRESPSTNIRAKLLLTPDAIPDLEAKLTFNYFDTRRPQTELVDNARSGGRQINNPLFSIFTNEVYAGTLDLKYQLSDAFQLRNSTVYTDNTSVRLDSVPGSAGLFTEELVNKFYIDYDDPNSRLSGLFGVYYLRSWQDADLVIVPDVFEVLLDGNATSLGIFGEIDIPLTERLTLTTGLRYQRDDKDRSGGQPLLDINFDQTFEAWLPKATLTFKASDDVTLGATVSRGYNPGAFNVNLDTLIIGEFDSEFLMNYELFFRSNLLDGQLQLNGNIFYTRIEDPQRSTQVIVNGLIAFLPINGEAAEKYGAEINLNYRPSDFIELSAGISLLDTEIISIEESLQIAAGNEFGRAPHFTGNFGIVVNPVEELTLVFNGRYNGSYFTDDANAPGGKVPGFFIADSQIAYEKDWLRVFAYASNIFDNRYPTLLFGDTDRGTIGNPREYGVGLEVRF